MKRADRCPHCGAPIAASRVSLRDIALITVCVAVLFYVGVPAILITGQWAEDETHRFMDRMVWHEPLDSWNL
jgi:hypothetical protein